MYMYLKTLIVCLSILFNSLSLVVARQQFFDIVSKETQDQFKTSIDKLLKHLVPPGGSVVDDTVRGLFFGDYMIQGADPRIYNEVTDFAELTTTIERWVGQWVWSGKGVDMLVCDV